MRSCVFGARNVALWRVLHTQVLHGRSSLDKALADLSLLRLELFLVDLAARVALAQDLKGRIGSGLLPLADQPTDPEYEGRWKYL